MRSLIERVESLSPDSRAIVERIVGRLELGAKRYGDWTEPRDMTAEALDEVLDCQVYVARSLNMLKGGRHG